jgi:hypothetical protein
MNNVNPSVRRLLMLVVVSTIAVATSTLLTQEVSPEEQAELDKQGQSLSSSTYAKPLAPGSGMLARALEGPMKGVEEVVFAQRTMTGGIHWYDNVGSHSKGGGSSARGSKMGKLCVLNLRTGQVRTLLDDPKGAVRDPAVHYDGKRIVFGYRKGDADYYHLYQISADGTGLTQLSDGPYDDIEPCWLPDGGIVFVSTRSNRMVPCWGTQVGALFRCDAGGKNVRELASGVEWENTPWVLADGRICYLRWEYVDRSRINYHHLWTINPDGTGQMAYFGNQFNGMAFSDAKPIPGANKSVAIFQDGHGSREHMGAVAVIDPDRGPDDFGAADIFGPVYRPEKKGLDARAEERKLKDKTTPLGGIGWRDPWPFSENCFLVCDANQLLLMDRQGRTEIVYESDVMVHEPRPLVASTPPPAIAHKTNWDKPTARMILSDVTHGRNMAGVKPGEIKKLLIMEELPRPVSFADGHMQEPINPAYAGTFVLHRILGTVPVEADGSADFEAPPLRPLFFVALDENNLSVKRMQSFVTLMPGETVSCVGCHEARTDVPRRTAPLMALAKPTAKIEPVAGVPEIIDFPRDVQPILDRNCAKCHDYSKPPPGDMPLLAARGYVFSHSYMALMTGKDASGKRLVSHGGQGKGDQPPRAISSSASALLKKLDGSHHDAKPAQQERDVVRLWIESSAVYAGTYGALDQWGKPGSGMAWSRKGPDKELKEVLDNRCASCHTKNKPALMNNHYLNLDDPAKSPLLLAPLAKDAGGWGVCKGSTTQTAKDKTATSAPAGSIAAVFANTNDPDYQKLLKAIQGGRDQLLEIKRFDMPDFQPSRNYIREMKRYGILPLDLDPTKTRVDPYKTDELYFRSFWHTPGGTPYWENNFYPEEAAGSMSGGKPAPKE